MPGRADAVAGRESDLGKAAATLRDLQAKWKAAAEAPRDRAQELWHRFRTPVDAVRGRGPDDIATQAGERAGNLTKKHALCERAEALAESTDWDAAASELKRLQADWKTIGPVRKSRSETIWKRFRASADVRPSFRRIVTPQRGQPLEAVRATA